MLKDKSVLSDAKEEKKHNFSLLEFQIESNGDNLSSGEKALICICRAVLKKSKIIILDEATATIDIKTEQIVQSLIDKSFKECTVIVIAHRLQTIKNSDKVLVLADGYKKEFGNPQKLLKDPNSEFSRLCAKMKKAEK